MSVLVTGGTGCLGHHLLNIFTRTKGELISYSFDQPRPRNKLKHVTYYTGNILDTELLIKILNEHQPTEIYHLAAQNSVGVSQKKPFLTLQTNVLGTQNLFECLRKTVPKSRVVVVSTCEVYGGGKGVVEMIHSEKDPIIPMTPLATSKSACELIAQQYINSHGMNVSIVRPFHYTGPFQSIQYVLPSIARQIAEIELYDRELTIYAGNLDISRDFTDVRESARGIALTMSTGQPGEVYNICSGKAIPIRELVEMLIRQTKLPIDIRIDPALERHVDIPMLVGSPEKLMTLSGWKPIISIEDSLKDLYSEMKRRIKLSKKNNTEIY